MGGLGASMVLKLYAAGHVMPVRPSQLNYPQVYSNHTVTAVPPAKPPAAPVAVPLKSPPPPPAAPPQSPARYIGLFVSSAPSNSGSLAELDSVAALGGNVVYNYSALDGTPAQIRAYLDHATALNIKVIIGLDDLYGKDDEAIALAAVKSYQAHPGVWGFGIADEKPETPADSTYWLPIITTRYQRIKQLTSKPVMAIAVGWTSANDGERQAFLRSLAPAEDTLAIDNYPIPYFSSSGIASIVADGPPERDRWFIAQAFNWSSYPDTAKGLGYDLTAARYPTAIEMESMARQALTGGASSVLFYSYFDIQSNPAQMAVLAQVMHSLKSR